MSLSKRTRRLLAAALPAAALMPACGGRGAGESATLSPRPGASDVPAASAARCVGPADVREAPADASGGPPMFPVLLPVANADPALRQAQTLQVPTRLRLRPIDGGFEAAWDEGSLEPAEVDVGCNMILGHEVHDDLVAEGREALDAASELGGGADFSEASSSTPFRLPEGSAERPWRLRAALTIFETDIPPQHEWSPRDGRYRVLLERTMDATLPARAE